MRNESRFWVEAKEAARRAKVSTVAAIYARAKKAPKRTRTKYREGLLVFYLPDILNFKKRSGRPRNHKA